ncbi:MAG: PQQ-binding-like beta-propeller repeat protein [Chloroflexota bacterium]
MKQFISIVLLFSLFLTMCIPPGCTPVEQPEFTTQPANTSQEAEPARFTVTGITATPSEKEPERLVVVTGNVANVGGERGSCELELLVGEESKAGKSLTLDASAEKEVSFTVQKEAGATYTFRVGEGIEERTFQVVAPPEEEEFTVVTPPAEGEFRVVSPKFEIIDLTADPPRPCCGEPVTIEATVANVGDMSASCSVVLFVEDMARETRSIHLAPGEEKTVSFTVTMDEPKTYTVRLSHGTSERNFTVMDPKFKVKDLTVTPREAGLEEPVTVKATVVNTDERTAFYNFELMVNGKPAGSKSLTLEKGEEREISFTVIRTEPGEYTISLGDLSQTLTVVERSPAQFEIRDFTITPREVMPGQPATIEATVINVGEKQGTCTVSLLVEGGKQETRSITLDGGQKSHISFSVSRMQPGSYTLGITKAVHERTVTVVECEPTPTPAEPTPTPSTPTPTPSTPTPTGCIQVKNIKVNPSDPEPGQSFTVRGTAVNTCDSSDMACVYLMVGGKIVTQTKCMTLLGHDQSTITLTARMTEARTAVLRLTRGGATVLREHTIIGEAPAEPTEPTEPAEPEEQPAQFEITDISFMPSEAEPGDPVIMQVTMANIGDESGTYDVNLTIAGEVVDTKSVTLEPDQEKAVEFITTMPEEGTYSFSIGAVSQEPEEEQPGATGPGTEKWTFNTGSMVQSSPAIDSGGTVYAGSLDGRLYSINSDGTKKWEFGTGNAIYSSPTIGPDGTIYIGSNDNKLYAVDQSGTVKWSFSAGDNVTPSPAIGQDGTIYVGSEDGKLYAIDSNGTRKWAFETGGGIHSSAAIGPDGTIYVGSADNYLYALNPDGTMKWSYETNNKVVGSPAVSADGTVYVGSLDGKLYAIDSNGTKKWEIATGSGIYSSPVIGADGTLYVGSGDGMLYAITPDGTQKWTFETGSGIYSSPAIGSDGTIYVGSWDGRVYALNPDGTRDWAFNTQAPIMYSSLTIGPNGTVYVGSTDNRLYAINSGSPGLAEAPWPMFGHDQRHTGRS